MSSHEFSGDLSGLTCPADYHSLAASGARFLTHAFRKTGVVSHSESVSAIESLTPFEGGSTGRKAVLTVSYEPANPTLQRQLFVKFSRDFEDPARDLTRVQMASEIYIAQLSAMPGFPVVIPRCFFADYEAASGSGILITEQIPFGEQGIEPLMPKSVDHLYSDASAYYRLVLKTLGTLAGTHSAGKLPSTVEQWFPYAPETLLVNTRKPPSAAELAVKIDQLERFLESYPGLLPLPCTVSEMISSLRQGAHLVADAEQSIFSELAADRSYIALCHWNAQLDNAWFWQDATGERQCGLMDWGNAGQLNVAMAIWGCLCGAHNELWGHIDEMLEVFINAFCQAGGKPLDHSRVMTHLDLYIAHMGVRYMLDTPFSVQARLPAGSSPTSYLDPVIQGDERMRSQLAILANFLGRWMTRDYCAMIRELISK